MTLSYYAAADHEDSTQSNAARGRASQDPSLVLESANSSFLAQADAFPECIIFQNSVAVPTFLAGARCQEGNLRFCALAVFLHACKASCAIAAEGADTLA